jgi:hypothetical protein
MKARKSFSKQTKWFKRVNWFGVAAAIAMLALPFLGAWWRVNVGGEAVTTSVSPFRVTVTALGEEVSIPIIWYVCLGAKLTIFAGGVIMLIGSVTVGKWWSKKLVSFGYSKVPFMVVGLVVMAAIGAWAANTWFGLSLPYVVGSSVSTLSFDGADVILPFSATLTPTFWVAVLVAALAIAARIYHRRFVEPSKS